MGAPFITGSSDHAAVTPSDATVFGRPFYALWVGGGGTVVITSLKGVDASFTVGANTMLEVAGNRVKATGTTATLMVAIFY